LLAVIGLYGLTSYMVARRRKEIGIQTPRSPSSSAARCGWSRRRPVWGICAWGWMSRAAR